MPSCPIRHPGAESFAACARRSYRQRRALISFVLPWSVLPTPCLLGRRGSIFNLTERRAADNLFQSPTLQLAGRPCLADAHHIAHACRVLFIVSVELLRALDD